MTRRFSTVGARGLLTTALASLFIASAAAGDARAQEAWGSPDYKEPLAGTTRKFDEYGKVSHCDETARLDNFAITIQNEPGTTGYLMVYFGRNDLPAWKEGLLIRVADYLVSSRGMSPERVKVVGAGYREERTTELWVVAGRDAPPEPTDTVEVKHDKTKAYQWNEHRVNIEFNADPEPEEPEEAEEAEDAEQSEPARAEGEKVAAEANAAPAEEDAGTEAWRKDVEKYEIAVVTRGVIEDEPEEEEPAAVDSEEAGAAASSEASPEPAAEEAPEGDAAPEQEETPVEGEVKVSLWWNVERLAEELKGSPGARVCLVYYYGAKNASREKMQTLVKQALFKTEEQLGVKRERIIVIEGGRGEAGVELWVVPEGAEPPEPKPGTQRNFGFYSAPGEE